MAAGPGVPQTQGETCQVFDQLRAQGYVRVRVDGQLYEIDAVPPLALRQKHTIEAVIDRFKPVSYTHLDVYKRQLPARPL